MFAKKVIQSVILKGKKDWYFTVALFAVFLIGFLIRIIGTNPGFPQTHPDEPVLYATSINMVINKTLDPFSFPIYKFYYPGLTIYLYAFLFEFVFIPISWGLRILSNQSTALSDIVGPGFVNVMYWSRYVTAILTSLSIPLVYLIGKKMFNKYAGLIAALFLAVNYRHALSGHFSLTDGPNATFALFVLYVALLAYKNPTLKNYLLLGGSVALSLSTKLHFYSILPLLFVHALFLKKKRELSSVLKEFFNIKFILAFLFLLIVFLLLNPYLPFNLDTAKKTIDYYNLRIGLLYPPFEITFPSIWYLYEIGFGKIMSLLFLIGIVLIIKNKKNWVNGIFLSFFIFLPGVILFYFSHGAAYVRYFASITPFAVIVSAFSFWTIYANIWKNLNANKRYFFPLFLFAAILVNFDQIKNSLELDYFATKPWNSACIQQWMDTNIKKGDTVAVNNLVPRSKNEGIIYTVFDNTENHKHAFALERLQEKGIDYVVADIEYLRGRFNWWVSASQMYWGPPVDIFDNSFDGLVLKELSRYIVKACIKPWQSPENNFIAIKIPKRKEPLTLTLEQSYDFKKDFGKIWDLSNPFHSKISEDVRIIKSKECSSGYCLKVEGKSNNPSREKIVISGLIPVSPGKKYFASIVIKSIAGVGSENRDGFLRIDYYGSDSADFTKRGIIASVSPRYFGEAEADWKELTVSQVSPAKAKYMQVSFQVERYNVTFLIDEVKVYRSDEKPSREEINASNRKEIDNEVLYPFYLL